jgi:hypothetical protein
MPPLGRWKFCSNLGCQDEMPRFPLRDRGAAREWVQQWKNDTFRMSEMRRFLSEDRMSCDVSRISDDLVVDQIADLFVSGLLHIHVAPTVTTAGSIAVSQPQSAAASAGADTFVPFPLSARSARTSHTPSRDTITPPPDPPTLPSDTDYTAQAAVLIAAAQAGTPTCYI